MNKGYRRDQIKPVLNMLHVICLFDSYNADPSVVSANELVEALATVSFDDIDEYRNDVCF